MTGLGRTFLSLALASGLATATPLVALADPGPIEVTVTVTDPAIDVTVLDSGVTVTTTDTSVVVTTTGTTATATVPGTSATVLGGTAPPGTPSLTVAPGSGAATSTADASTSGSGLSHDGAAALGGPALVLATSTAGLDQGAALTTGVDEPTTGTALTAQAQAQVLLCLLATASVDPTEAVLDLTCADGASTTDGAGSLALTNALTGTTVSSHAVLRAAICLIATAASPLPGGSGTDALVLAKASLTTLCGASPSTAGADGALTVTNDATGTTIDTAPAVDAAICLLVNGVVGDPTTLQLASTCGLNRDAAPTTAGASAPTAASEGITGTDASLQPALEAVVCVLANALVQLGDLEEATATASIATACADAPSTGTATAPATVENDTTGTSADLAPSIDAAICILAAVQAGLSGATIDLTDPCAAPAAGTTPGDTTGTTPTTDTDITGAAPGGPQSPGDTGDQGIGAVTGPGLVPERSGAERGAQFPGLPSSSTALGGLAILALAALAFLASTSRRSRGSKKR